VWTYIFDGDVNKDTRGMAKTKVKDLQISRPRPRTFLIKDKGEATKKIGV